MAKAAVKCFLADNFAIEGTGNLLDYENLITSTDNTLYDERTGTLSYNTDRSTWKWYYNYVNSVSILAQKNPNAPACNLLDLGYVPLVYLPTCATNMENDLFTILDVTKIPYVKLRKTSFVFSKVDLTGADAWISRMDAAPMLGCAPENVRSEDCIRRFLLNE